MKKMIFLVSLLTIGCGGKSVVVSDEITLKGYLVDQCVWQAFPGFSTEDGKCSLDVFLSEKPVSDPFIADICDGAFPTSKPFSSSCYFRQMDYTIDSTTHVKVTGKYIQTEICSSSGKGPGDPPPPPICHEGQIFVPSKITAE